MNQISNNIDYNYLLFKKVWGNIIIRNEIKYYLRLYSFHFDRIYFTIEQIKTYKFRNYIYDLEIVGNGNKNGDIFKADYSKIIPTNVQKLKISGFKLLEDQIIPNIIKSLEFESNDLYYENPQMFNKNIYQDCFDCNGNSIAGDNIVELDLGNFNRSLGIDDIIGVTDRTDKPSSWLPRNLTSLKLGDFFQQNIYIGQLPNSLTSLKLSPCYQGIISRGSIPKSVTTLDYEFLSNENFKKLEQLSIFTSITNLRFDDKFDQNIKPGFIPHNVCSLKFGFNFNSTIELYSLPQSLESLEFNFCYNQPLAQGIFPSNLTSLIFGSSFNQPITFNIKGTSSDNDDEIECIIPSSITKLHFGNSFNQPITSNTFKKLTNLKDLKISRDNSEPPFVPGSLPKSLESLDLNGYYHPLYPGLLPESLISLIYSYNYTIPPNTLPNSITSLYLEYGHLDQPLHSNSIPTNLKSLYINHYCYYDLSLIDWPASLENIYLGDLEFLNILPKEFFIKYIKLLKYDD